MKWKKWTREEDLILMEQIRRRPQNLSLCFIAVAEKLGRTPLGAENRWYGHLARTKEAETYLQVYPKVAGPQCKAPCRRGFSLMDALDGFLAAIGLERRAK